MYKRLEKALFYTDTHNQNSQQAYEEMLNPLSNQMYTN